jgi:hypothetical protein
MADCTVLLRDCPQLRAGGKLLLMVCDNRHLGLHAGIVRAAVSDLQSFALAVCPQQQLLQPTIVSLTPFLGEFITGVSADIQCQAPPSVEAEAAGPWLRDFKNVLFPYVF